MKPRGSSSLNPNATSYFPLTDREVSRTGITENSSNDSTREPNLRNPPVDNLSPSSNTRPRQNTPVRITAPVRITSPPNNPPVRRSVSQSSYALSEVEKFDRQFKLDLKHLLANFCNHSEEFLTGVYLDNKADLNAAVDTLKQLESKYAPEYDQHYEGLPDSLGIADPSESGPAAVGRPTWTKHVARASSKFLRWF